MFFLTAPVDRHAVANNDDILVRNVICMWSLGVPLGEFQTTSVRKGLMACEFSGQGPVPLTSVTWSECVANFVGSYVDVKTVCYSFPLVSAKMAF